MDTKKEIALARIQNFQSQAAAIKTEIGVLRKMINEFIGIQGELVREGMDYRTREDARKIQWQFKDAEAFFSWAENAAENAAEYIIKQESEMTDDIQNN